MEKSPPNQLRLDKWLWAARLYKTRQIAAKAIGGGHVEVNGVRVKPAKLVQPGDELRLKKGPFAYVLLILGLSAKRGPAKEARLLYSETEASRGERERQAEIHKSRLSQVMYDPNKPSSREQRAGRIRKREQP